MKKITYIVLLSVLMSSCTSNEMARKFGGNETVELQPNRVLVNVTWKENNMWILTKDTITNQMYFNEKSSYGLMEGQVTFVGPQTK